VISAVDTNVLLDILIPGARHRDTSERLLADAVEEGTLILSEAVYAELAAHFINAADLERFVDDTRLQLSPSTVEVLSIAGDAWRRYVRQRGALASCAACGAQQELRCISCGEVFRLRQHISTDFLIDSHAVVLADRLLTRDKGYYATYFPNLKLT
jgi:predicted nucleic acid-binding protein